MAAEVAGDPAGRSGREGSQPPDVAVIGGGLAGSLAALALARRQLAVMLISPAAALAAGGQDAAATALSYGSVAGLAAAARWLALESRHGPLGWHASAVVLHGLGAAGGQRRSPLLRSLASRLPLVPAPLPFSRVDGCALARALPPALAAAGVLGLQRRVRGLQPAPGGGWRLELDDGTWRSAPRVLLTTGGACRSLWPSLPGTLRTSWAGVLVQPRLRGRSRWLDVVRRGWMVFPRHLRRPALERQSSQAPPQARWVVDVSLAPWGEGLLAGQITWLPAPQTAASGAPTDLDALEGCLRRELGRLDPALAALEAGFHLVPVSYSSDGVPLAAEVAPGLWVLAGCSNAYSHLPALADGLAARIAAAAQGEPGRSR